jgi:hypothetical protein
MPACEIVLQYANKALFRIVTLLGAGSGTNLSTRSRGERALAERLGRVDATPDRTYAPKDEIRMRHEVRYALEHAPGFEDEGREGDFVEVHADSGGRFVSRRVGLEQAHGVEPTVVVK